MGTTVSHGAKPVDALLEATAKTIVTTAVTGTIGSAHPPLKERRNSLLIRNNDVAPIIIKNCKEEYQRVNNFTDPIVYAQLTETSEEHALIQNKYFLMRDVYDDEDRIGSLPEVKIPNLRTCRGARYPVYAMGQPTKDGLTAFLQGLKDKGHDCILLFNLRLEPVVFIRETCGDFIPYSPRTADNLCRSIVTDCVIASDVTNLETKIRTEIINLAALRDKAEFFCYSPPDVSKVADDQGLKMFSAAYEDDLEVTDEVYSRLAFNNSGVRYNRVPLTEHAVPTEKDIDIVLQTFAELPDFFSTSQTGSIQQAAIVFTSHVGVCRGTYGMLLGCLLMSHKMGFPSQARDDHHSGEGLPNGVCNGIDSKDDEHVVSDAGDGGDGGGGGGGDRGGGGGSSGDGGGDGAEDGAEINYKLGEYQVIKRLVEYLPNGELIKHQVDVLTDITNELHDARLVAFGCKQQLERYDEDYQIEGESAKHVLLCNCVKHIQRYFYLICVNSYLHSQYKNLFAVTFTYWMETRPYLLYLLTQTDISERSSSVSLITSGERVLVSDDYIGLDLLSSMSDVAVSNFRKFPSLNIYGMAQPTRKGVEGILKFLTNSKQQFRTVTVVCLREDMCVDADDLTYGPREANALSRPINMPGITTREIELKETKLRDEILQNKEYKIYMEIDREQVFRSFNCVKTTADLMRAVQQNIGRGTEDSTEPPPAPSGGESDNTAKPDTAKLTYHRIPMCDDKAPTDQIFDAIMAVVLRDEKENNADEDGPALVFCCRTGKGRTTTAMVIAGLIVCHVKGFPYGTKPGQEDRVSIPNADLTNGNYKVVQQLIRRIPNGQQVKREVDFILDQCSDTMTPMHYHMREVILVTLNMAKKAKTEKLKKAHFKRSLDQLERYIYLIIFNAYLHCDRHDKWQRSFTQWMQDIAPNSGIYEILDELTFGEEDESLNFKSRRHRWNYDPKDPLPFRGTLT